MASSKEKENVGCWGSFLFQGFFLLFKNFTENGGGDLVLSIEFGSLGYCLLYVPRGPRRAIM